MAPNPKARARGRKRAEATEAEAGRDAALKKQKAVDEEADGFENETEKLLEMAQKTLLAVKKEGCSKADQQMAKLVEACAAMRAAADAGQQLGQAAAEAGQQLGQAAAEAGQGKKEMPQAAAEAELTQAAAEEGQTGSKAGGEATDVDPYRYPSRGQRYVFKRDFTTLPEEVQARYNELRLMLMLMLMAMLMMMAMTIRRVLPMATSAGTKKMGGHGTIWPAITLDNAVRPTIRRRSGRV